jgi:hypothetical protein
VDGGNAVASGRRSGSNEREEQNDEKNGKNDDGEHRGSDGSEMMPGASMPSNEPNGHYARNRNADGSGLPRIEGI